MPVLSSGLPRYGDLTGLEIILDLGGLVMSYGMDVTNSGPAQSHWA